MKNLFIAALLAPALCLASPAAFAADSQFTGITIPRQGARFDAQNQPFTDFLREVAREGAVGLTPSGEAVEVFLWQGDSYRKDRIAFTQSALRSALGAAGYTVKEIPYTVLRDAHHYDHFKREPEHAFRPANTPDYFQAVNPTKGRAILGTWLDSDSALALAIMPVVFKAAPKPKPIPGAGAGVLIANHDDTAASLPRRVLPKFPPLSRKPRTVRGYLKDGAGRPLAGAEVSVYSSVGGGFRTTHRARSNAQGLYEVLLPTGIAEIAEVDTDVSYNGQKFNLKLDPISGEKKGFNAQNGHVEHYILRAQGKAGGTIRVLDNLESGVIEITLKAQGRLLDGSNGSTLIYRYNASEKSETFLNGMPLGRYQLTARLLDDGEALPLRARKTFGTGPHTTPSGSVPVDFEPGYTFSQVNSGKSNPDVEYFQVTLEP